MNLVLTLVDKDYYFGLAGLINSLVSGGFSGAIVVGATRPFPAWLTSSLHASDEDAESFNLGPIRLQRVAFKSSEHVVHCKPQWIAAMVNRFSTYERIAFIDADIVVNVEWPFFEQWIDCGVALCADINYLMPSSDPIRRQWVRILERSGRVVRTRHDLYFNSGFLGLKRSAMDFASLWADIYEENVSLFADTTQFRIAGREHVFMSANQDTLNLAAMVTDQRLSIMGPSAMGFTNGFTVMHHPLGADKPWRKAYISDALKGWPPRLADKEFWHYADGPIRPFAVERVFLKRLAIKCAATISRFIQRK